jgi:hypothetical protein
MASRSFSSVGLPSTSTIREVPLVPTALSVIDGGHLSSFYIQHP